MEETTEYERLQKVAKNLLSRACDAERENERLKEELKAAISKDFFKDVAFEALEFKKGSVEVKMKHPILSLCADVFISLFRSFDGAKNYLTVSFMDGGDILDITVQRREGQTPTEKVTELDAKCKELSARISELEAVERRVKEWIQEEWKDNENQIMWRAALLYVISNAPWGEK
jgi:hypothetical protein